MWRGGKCFLLKNQIAIINAIMLHTKRILLTIIILCCISCTDNKNSDSKSKLEKINSPEKSVYSEELFSIAKIDTNSQRVFVVIDSNFVADIKTIKLIVRRVEENYKFKNDLNVSFVSNKKYADYKTNLNENNNITYSEFYMNYLGEYNKASNTYWTFPALPERKIKYIF